MHIVIVANSPTFEAAPFRGLLESADLLIAVDGGGNALAAAGIVPQLVVGDLDSLADAARRQFAAAGAEICEYPAAKDETDLELALLIAAERAASRIDILGALGGRWDQSLSNVALLALPELVGIPVCLRDLRQMAWLVRDASLICGKIGDTVSLLPFGGPAHGITTQGLRWELQEASLPFERSRGVSNVLEAAEARLSLRDGMLLIIYQSDS
jgi:thiamine pyrophosphokinase